MTTTVEFHSSQTIATGRPTRPAHFRLLVAMLVLVVSGLFLGRSGVLPPPGPPPARPAPPPVRPSANIDPSWRVPASATELALRDLPADLEGVPELMAQRTANSATFQTEPDHYTTLLSAGRMHYLDGDGLWQTINPAFRQTADSFVVEHNSITSRAGLQSPWLTAAAGQTIFSWQATELGAVTSRGRFSSLALPQSAAVPAAETQESGRVLHYAGGWTDPQLSEAIISAPDSLEQLLILAAAPAVEGQPEFLEMRANLKLLPGASLWADGQERLEAFTTSGALEIHNTEGVTAVVFDPVLAFEQERSEVRVAGHYVVTPGEDANTWVVGVRTPWAWWNAPERRYPAAIDPTMRVLHPTGHGTGMAWVSDGNGDAPNQNYQLGKIVLGSNKASAPYLGVMQFNSLPALLTNSPVQVDSAQLDIVPSYYHFPSYKHDGPDYEKYPVVHRVNLWELNLNQICPNPLANPTCFSLIDDRLNVNSGVFNWNTRPNTADASQAQLLSDDKFLSVGPIDEGGPGQMTTFDVTGTLSDWYAIAPRPNHGPAFLISLPLPGFGACPANVPHPAPSASPQLEDVPQFVWPCTRFQIKPANAQLRITYQPLELAPGENYLNKPGVPSFLDGVFESTDHQYKLDPAAGPARWRGVAVRGNHDLPPAGLPAWANLQLLDYSGGGEPQILVESAQVQAADETSFVFIDDHSCALNGICNADLRASVMRQSSNDFATDQERNYRIDYQQAKEVSINVGEKVIYQITLPSDELLRLLEFELARYDDVVVTVTGPPGLKYGMVRPTGGETKQDAITPSDQVELGFGQDFANPEKSLDPPSYHSTSIPVTGMWALAIINTQPPVPDPEIPSQAQDYHLSVEIIRCPMGTIYARKFDDCQPVYLPDNNPLPRSAGDLEVHSEGGFQDGLNGDWCTKNEQLGTPLIESAFTGRWIVVAQGSVCWDEQDETLVTTPESGVGVVAPHPELEGNGLLAPSLMYGRSQVYPLPAGDPTGVVGSNDGVRFDPTPTTYTVIKPFEDHWKDVLVDPVDYISAADMKIHGDGTIQAAVTVEATEEPLAISWQVPWTLYPGSAGGYVININPVQTPPFHGSGGFVSMASLQLRLLGDSGVGLIERMDIYETNQAGQFRLGSAKVTQGAALGGASQEVQVVILPPGKGRLPVPEPGPGQKNCTVPGSTTVTSCLDIRAANYNFDFGDGDKAVDQWTLPDIHLEDQAGSLVLSRPGELLVFDKDHPQAGRSAQDIEQSFSFDTWGATVAVTEEPCTEDDTVEVTVVRGQGLIGLPTVGSASVPPSIKIGFKLCQSDLNEASLTLEIPTPGIPVGSTGVGVSLIGGQVTVGDGNTEITIILGFQTLDGATLTTGKGQVTINTGGMFSIGASATIVGILNANLFLQVAWAPLDILIDAGVDCCDKLISGQLYLHAWIGQGWQNKYNWLPDNNDFHFTGFIEAKLSIPYAYVIDFPPLPPFDFGIGLKISFGEFCTSADCTDYAWGLSAVLTVAGTDLGLYVDTSGPEFIFGTDDHILIDQFGGSKTGTLNAAAAAEADPRAAAPPPIIQPGNVQPDLLPPPTSPVAGWPVQTPAEAGCVESANSLECAFDPGGATPAGRATIVVSWQNGLLSTHLTAPDNTPINETNALAYGVSITQTNSVNPAQHQVYYAIKPVAGTATIDGPWKVGLTNIGQGLLEGTSNNYRLIFFSDPPPPTLTWQAPTQAGQAPSAGVFNLMWNASRGDAPLGDEVQIELIYKHVRQLPANRADFNGTLIVNRVEANDGSYAWNTRGLASGEYVVGARIDDHFSGNGHVVTWAPGTIVINDTVAPPPPEILSAVAIDDALIVTWEQPYAQSVPVPDLAGYLVEYTYPDWDLGARDMTRRVVPRGPTSFWMYGHQMWFQDHERIRLGGLLNDFETDVCVRAYDASGNVGECNAFSHKLPRDPVEPLGAPSKLEVRNVRPGNLLLEWLPPASGDAEGYLISYAPVGCLLPGQDATVGAVPIDVADVLKFTLSGLNPGQRYAIGVSAYTEDLYVGPPLSAIGTFGNLSDNDADGLPDAWAAVFGVNGSTNDPDADDLTNLDEYNRGSIPTHADSDHDGFYDGEERNARTGICDAFHHPSFSLSPKMTLFGPAQLDFQAATNQNQARTQTIGVFNLGGGVLNWSAATTETWIELEGLGSEELRITVDPTGLAPGSYSGMISINGTDAAAAIRGAPTVAAVNERVDIPVRMVVLPTESINLFLPVVRR